MGKALNHKMPTINADKSYLGIFRSMQYHY